MKIICTKCHKRIRGKFYNADSEYKTITTLDGKSKTLTISKGFWCPKCKEGEK